MSSVKKAMYDSLEQKFEADRAKAIATLELSFNHPVAIGEHPTLLDDMAKLVSDVATAEENLAALRDNFGEKAYPHGVTKDNKLPKIKSNAPEAFSPSETPDASWMDK